MRRSTAIGDSKPNCPKTEESSLSSAGELRYLRFVFTARVCIPRSRDMIHPSVVPNLRVQVVVFSINYGYTTLRIHIIVWGRYVEIINKQGNDDPRDLAQRFPSLEKTLAKAHTGIDLPFFHPLSEFFRHAFPLQEAAILPRFIRTLAFHNIYRKEPLR